LSSGRSRESPSRPRRSPGRRDANAPREPAPRFSDRRMKHNGGGVAGNNGWNGGGPQRRRPSRTDLDLERLLAARRSRLRRGHRKRRSVLLVIALVLASVIALLLATVAFTGQQILTSTCSLSDLRPLRLGENSFLYTDNMRLHGVVPSATNLLP